MRTIILLKHIPFTYLDDDFIIGVERGALDAINNNIKLNVAVGDFDSVSNIEYLLIEKKFKTIKLPIKKDLTDLAYAISLSETNDIIILGGIEGRRVEHLFANINLLINNVNIELRDEYSIIKCLTPGNYQFFKDEYKFISFFAIEDINNISLDGFLYNLENYNLKKYDSLCISNEIIEGKLSFDSGLLLVIKSKKDA